MTIEESTGDIGLFVTSARNLMRDTGVACLATLESGVGSPYASMITAATETGGSPIFLISRLALHTRNLEADPRASILFMSTAEAGDPLALGRISAIGVAEKTDDALNRERFLARHPEATGYAGFADFSFWRLHVEKAHYVGGFGRIGTLEGSRLIRQGPAIDAWNAEISRVLINCPDELQAKLASLAARQGGREGDWKLAACDPEGCELTLGARAVRLTFPQAIEDVNQVPEVLQRLASGEATSR